MSKSKKATKQVSWHLTDTNIIERIERYLKSPTKQFKDGAAKVKEAEEIIEEARENYRKNLPMGPL